MDLEWLDFAQLSGLLGALPDDQEKLQLELYLRVASSFR